MMENQFHIITGLPGSGKSKIAKLWADNWKYADGQVILFDGKYTPSDIMKAVGKTKQSCILVDPNLVDPKIAKKASAALKAAFPNHHQQWYYVQSTYMDCLQNLQSLETSEITSMRHRLLHRLKDFKKEQHGTDIVFIPLEAEKYTEETKQS
jgi:ABC-type transport system involved in cytochrome bd biosynthesis fused ATPase/permease subunit